MQTLLARPRPCPRFLAGAHSMQTLLARARPRLSFLAGDHPRLQTIPLSEDLPEMFPGPAENSVDAQRGHSARSPDSLTLRLRLSMGIWTPLALSSVQMTRPGIGGLPM